MMATTTVAMSRRLFTVEEYHRMGEAGILRPGERTELIDGEIIVMSPIGGPHFWCVVALTTAFGAQVEGRAYVSAQNPIRILPWSEPEPDLVLLRAPKDPAEKAIPTPADVLLLVEVSDTSLRYDRDVKLPRYAAAGVQEVWIVDLNAKCITVYREPLPAERRYQHVTICERGSTLSPLAFPDIILNCDEILG